MSIHSMTAFARESSGSPFNVVIELRSVNQRYLDLHFRLPDTLRALEPRLRERLGDVLGRGKVDCQLRIGGEGGAELPGIDRQRLTQLLALLGEVQAALPAARAPDALSLLQFPGICDTQRVDSDELQAAAMACFERTLQSLIATRAREGEQLEGFLRQRLDAVSAVNAALRSGLPELRQRQEDRLRRRLLEFGADLDQGRLEQELVYLLQKSDVDEELDRLDAHLRETRRVLDQGGPCGRRLDFLMQEFNREANTLSSKSTASSTTQSAVELKVLIEQMREQVQNIE
jgi:uncharacterized protein (TIGR00255 family)